MGPRAREGQLPGGSGNATPTLRQPGRQRKPQFAASQPGQPKVLMCFQGCSELLGARKSLDGFGASYGLEPEVVEFWRVHSRHEACWFPLVIWGLVKPSIFDL